MDYEETINQLCKHTGSLEKPGCDAWTNLPGMQVTVTESVGDLTSTIYPTSSSTKLFTSHKSV